MPELEVRPLPVEELKDFSTRTEDSFLQSLAWEEVQRRYGRETRRVLVGTNPLLCIKNDLRFGLSYWYSPRPFIQDEVAFFEAARVLAKEALFFRVEPVNEVQRLKVKVQKSFFSLQPSAFSLSTNLQPKETILIDLTKSEEEMLGAMHPKTRYNIRLAERHGVQIETRSGKEALDCFYRLLGDTAERDGFSLHPKGYYECLLSSNSEDFENRLFFALHGGEIAAAAMVNFYRGTATYLHGASNYALRNIMAPYVLHWGIIEDAKVRGCHTYDFGGIDEMRWPGITRFKGGFGGSRKVFPGALDVPGKPFYYQLYRLARGIRRA
ncbi:MAG: peptidoglycan bridge formation glycyltransferase FemA/FemB family protein [Candidatus Sungbacteria bacterium]|nr:peptidoglycan bridge formation glycyltransferase FemA/FemB family protein [Candidatus Sungbacteria bacterium]